MFLSRVDLLTVPLLAVVFASFAAASWGQHQEVKGDNATTPLSRTVIDRLIDKKLDEISRKEKEAALLQQAVNDAKSAQNGTAMITVPAVFMGAAAMWVGVGVASTPGNVFLKEGSSKALERLIAGGLAVGGATAVGGSNYFIYVSVKQQRLWREKLTTAQRQLQKNREELEKLKRLDHAYLAELEKTEKPSAEEHSDNSKSILKLALDKRLTEIADHKKQIETIEGALQTATSGRDRIFKIAIPVTALAGLGIIFSATGIAREGFFNNKTGVEGMTFALNGMVRAGLIVSGSAAAGTGIYVMTVSHKQKKQWEEKLSQAKTNLSSTERELTELQVAIEKKPN